MVTWFPLPRPLLPGINVFSDHHMPPPRDPTPGEWAARYVRRSLHARLGEHLVGKPGPDPDDPVLTAFVISGELRGHPQVIKILMAADRKRRDA